ncbi:hypothetical protein Emtol_2708 [Emticicia oligotrophica DSM 17448]|jgi:hypothetical protein|uniref:DUF4064 domain-containing protein n=1 Tax=Emticicia oligotrophica (strain DSM 17448 / CIP 109782 / MTCC 6937 / GPTSA100-15) TaxID=929562 RepID=A0ABM5N3B0_EMTOG|nr:MULTISPECIES: hypothetical protein [Emticicia]AFK03844.1 hypothetical protein Emtol_2708 [Emticicia oligotrophica DSM 17448]
MQNPFEENTGSVRPTLLTILCVLTLIWNAYKFYGAIPNTFTPEKVMESKEQANEMMMDMFSKYMSEKDIEKVEESQAETEKMFQRDNLVLAGGVNLISSLLIMLGAIWMWGLRKKGFWVYIAGNVVGILAPIVIFGGSIGWSIGIMSLIASAIFTGLYAINLKYLV